MKTASTVLDVVQSTTAYFKKHDVEHPRLNAEHLLAHSLGCKRLELYLQFERALHESELAPLRELVRRRGQGEPLQHLLGTVEFCGQTFLCDKRALVPRPETEQLVELVIANSQSPIANMLDVGTGSGVIALSLALRFPDAQMTASRHFGRCACAWRRKMRPGLDWSTFSFVQSDLLGNIDGQFDVIVANLPYVAVTERGSLSREVLHDPEVALFAGEKGDELMRALVEAAPNHIRPGGLLALEIGGGHGDSLSGLLSLKNYHDISLKKDYAGVTRFLLARYG